MAADLEGIGSYAVDEIDKIDFREFSLPIANSNRGKEFSELYIDHNNFVSMWKNTLRTLKIE